GAGGGGGGAVTGGGGGGGRRAGRARRRRVRARRRPSASSARSRRGCGRSPGRGGTPDRENIRDCRGFRSSDPADPWRRFGREHRGCGAESNSAGEAARLRRMSGSSTGGPFAA